MYYLLRHLSAVAAALAAGLVSAAGSVAQEHPDAKQILEISGVRAGLCVQLGSGGEKSADLTAELAARSQLLVHGLAVDDVSLQRARRAIAAKGVSGQALVEKLPLNPLPYLRDLANLVVVEDLVLLQRQGLEMREIERIVAPGGVICIRHDGVWAKTVKPRPQDMDDWTHPMHGPDGNRVSADRVVQFPVGLRWQAGLPMNFNLWAACRGWVLANGRCFTLSTTEPENLGPASFSKHKQEQYLTARDAFNGLPLWKVNCETSDDGQALNAFNIAPLLTNGLWVWAYKKDRVVALDAGTGQIERSYVVKYPTARLVLADGMLVSSGWESRDMAKDSGRADLWSHWVHKTSAGAVEAFDAQNASLKWSVPKPAQEVLVADGLAYLLIQSGNPVTEQTIWAVDLKTGEQRWSLPAGKFPLDPDLHLNYAGRGVLVISRGKAKAISVLAAADGKLAWEIQPADQFWTPVVDGLLWHGNKKYDPKTGAVKGTLTRGVSSPVCTPAAVVGRYVTASRGGDYIDLGNPADEKPQAAHLRWAAARGGCIEGAVPANGMFYTSQNNCRCSPGQVPGFVAFGPSGSLPVAADFEQTRPLEKGPAFGSSSESPASAADWPMFYHDAARSGAAQCKLAGKLERKWQAGVAKPAAGPLAEAWKARLTTCLSGPVVADGLVFAAAVDAGEVVALEAASGRQVWRVSAGGRIDSPPTIVRGLCLFGSHDGWLYALRARDGQLAWRTRVAPWERRMVAFGQVESVWPAHGSVVVQGGMVYATAGRSTETDGGVAVCAFDPTSGRQIWAKGIGPGPARENDVLTLRDGKLVLHHVEIDPQTGTYAVAAKLDGEAGLEGRLDGSWARLGTRRSGNLPFNRVHAELLAWNDTTVFGFQTNNRSCFAIDRSRTAGSEKDRLKNEDFAWRLVLPAGHQAEALALCESGLLLGGKVCLDGAEPMGFVWLISLDKGQKIWEERLLVPVTFNGLTVAQQQVFVSLQDGQVVCYGKAAE